MVYRGHIENGVVVFHEPVPLANGIPVHVEEAEAQAEAFWESCTIDELGRRQGVSVPRSIQEVLGGWPEDELDDGFENVVASWRERALAVRLPRN